MKRLIIATVMLVTGFFISAVTTPPSQADSGSQERAIVEFKQPVKLIGVQLKGTYLVLHDDDKKAQGEACLYVYRLKNGQPDKLIVAFHCERVERKKAEQFTIQVSRLSHFLDLTEIQEIQFAGSPYGHRIPSASTTHAGHH